MISGHSEGLHYYCHQTESQRVFLVTTLLALRFMVFSASFERVSLWMRELFRLLASMLYRVVDKSAESEDFLRNVMAEVVRCDVAFR
jgi:hypothetical protein